MMYLRPSGSIRCMVCMRSFPCRPRPEDCTSNSEFCLAKKGKCSKLLAKKSGWYSVVGRIIYAHEGDFLSYSDNARYVTRLNPVVAWWLRKRQSVYGWICAWLSLTILFVGLYHMGAFG